MSPESSVTALTIEGCPRTKKNHTRRVWSPTRRRTVTVQSEAHEAWEEAAIIQLRAQWKKRAPIAESVNLRALIYREKDHGDTLNFLAAVSDVLERAGILVNDRQVKTLDGSRPLVDKRRPRVEIELTLL